MKRRSLITGAAAAVVAATFTDLTLADDKVKNPLTIVKVGNDTYKPTPEDLERWRDIFAGKISLDDCPPHMKQDHISVEVLEAEPDYHSVLLVRVGNDEYKPTEADLEAYRKVFEEAANDKDFKIFTHQAVHVERIKFGSGGVIIDED
jgi:hypothetical protein